VLDALARGDVAGHREELGDLLMQVVFQAALRREQGAFDFDGVVESICDKLMRRHPHVFGDELVADVAELSQAWESHKAREREASGTATSLLDDVPLGLPALTRAAKLGRRASNSGFDWPDWRGARAKIAEELDELDRAIEDPRAAEQIAAEMGDVLFALVNLARHFKVDPEAALRATNERFSQRFRYIEEQVRASGRSIQDLDLDALDALWNEAKKVAKDQ